MMKKTGLMCLLLLLGARGAWAQGGDDPVAVRTALVQEEVIADPVEAIGTARAWEFVSVRATETERIARIAFAGGQWVKAGDVLVELDHAEESAELDGARASLARYRRDAERLRKLEHKKLATAEQLDAAETLVAETRARAAMLEARIGDRVIRAPFAGQLGLRNVSVGGLVSPSEEITTLQDVSRLKVDFTVPERRLPQLAPGMEVHAHSRAHPGRDFRGEILLVDPRVDAETRAATVRARFDNPEGLLRPGMLLAVEVVSNPRSALTIPESALLPVADQQWVFVLESSGDGYVVQRRAVQLGRRYTGKVEVLSGLSAGQQVVTRGGLKIRDGQSVTPEVAEDATAAVGQS